MLDGWALCRRGIEEQVYYLAGSGFAHDTHRPQQTVLVLLFYTSKDWKRGAIIIFFICCARHTISQAKAKKLFLYRSSSLLPFPPFRSSHITIKETDRAPWSKNRHRRDSKSAKFTPQRSPWHAEGKKTLPDSEIRRRKLPSYPIIFSSFSIMNSGHHSSYLYSLASYVAVPLTWLKIKSNQTKTKL